jgi:hypothetical protein
MKASIPVGFTLIALFIASGCQSVPRPASGMSGLHVKVIAEPKAGVRPPPSEVRVYDAPAEQRGYGAFEKVDYSNLGDIVVWAEPVGQKGAAHSGVAALSVAIDPREPATGLAAVASVGQRVVLTNRSSRPQEIYSVSDGNDFDLGKIPPGRQGTYAIRSPGLIEVLTDSSADAAARVYAAPTPWVKLARAGEWVSFNNLPPGPCRLLSWHPRLPGSEITVTLSPNDVTTATIKVGVNSLPKVEPNTPAK